MDPTYTDPLTDPSMASMPGNICHDTLMDPTHTDPFSDPCGTGGISDPFGDSFGSSFGSDPFDHNGF